MIATTAILSMTVFVLWMGYYMQTKYNRERTAYLDGLKVGDTVGYYWHGHIVYVRIVSIDRVARVITIKSGREIEFDKIITL